MKNLVPSALQAVLGLCALVAISTLAKTFTVPLFNNPGKPIANSVSTNTEKLDVFKSSTYSSLAAQSTAPQAVSTCSLIVTPTVSGCYSVSGVSKATVSVEVDWNNAPAGDYIIVTTGAQSRTIVPGISVVTYPQPSTIVITGSQNIVTPQVIAFEMTLSGAASISTVTAKFASNTTCQASQSYNLPAACPPTACTGTQLGGTVYRDFNADGIQQATETQGVSSVTVTAYDCDGIKYGPVSTDLFGKYAFNSTTIKYPVRIEFTTPTGTDVGTTYGANSKSNVQFVSQATCSVNFGIANPSLYCQDNPSIFIPCYTYGDPLNLNPSPAVSETALSANAAALVSFPYDQTATAATNITHVTDADILGTVWGLGYNRVTKDLFMAATLHRHSGLGALGIGGIYVTHTGSTSATQSFIDVSTLGINVGAASVPVNGSGGRDLSADLTKPSHDPDVLPLIGKVGIGGLEVAEDGQKIWFVNLYDKKLYSIDISQYNTSATLPTSADVKSYVIPDPGCLGGESRPWALHIYGGKLYVGTVCDALTSEKKSNLRAYVYSFDPATSAFTSIFDFPLTYPKGYGISPLNSAGQAGADSTGWFPWTDTFSDLIIPTSTAVYKSLVHPQPILADIDFDVDGSMVLGFADRTGFQGGYNNYSPDPAETQLYTVNPAAGDVLRAFYSNGSYILENNGKAGPFAGVGVNNKQGPGFGEFYDDNYISGNRYTHTELVLGGLALKSGSGHVVGATIDPVENIANSGGVKYWNNETGVAEAAAIVYTTSTAPGTFAKASGLGEPELNCDLLQVIEIGNRVWLDTDKNGIQDPCEKALAGVQVDLYKGTTKIASTTTSADGEYYFSHKADLTTGTWLGTGADTTLLANTAYSLVFGGSLFTNNTLSINGSKLALTLANSTTTNANELNDSDASVATVAGITAPVISVTTGSVGYINHNFDVGFICTPTTVTSVSVTPATCPVGGTVANSNASIKLTGIQNADKAFLITTSTIPSYTATGSSPVSASAVSFTGLANPTSTSGTSYSVVLYSGPCCYTVISAVLPQQTCTVCSISATAAASCNNNGTIDNTADDYISFVLTPSNVQQGNRFTVTATQGGSPIAITFPDGSTVTAGASMSALSYAYPTPFRTPVGTAGHGNIILTITDVNNATCTTQVTVVDPGVCALAACVGTTPVSVSYAYQTPFQTTELTDVPLLLPKFDDGGGSRTLTGVVLSYKVVEGTNFLFENTAANANTFKATVTGDALISLSGNQIADALYPSTTTGNVSLPAGITVAAQGTYPGDAPYGISNVSTLEGMDSWLSALLEDIYVDPRLDPRWVTTATGNSGNDADIYVWAPQSFSASGVSSYSTTVDLAQFLGSGYVPLLANTLNGFSLSGGGGNVLAFQNTKAYACASVVYTYICTGCSLTATATPTACNTATNQYSVSGTISLSNTAGGVATITDGAKSSTVSVGVSATSVAYSLSGLTSGTGSHTVVVSLPDCGTAVVTYSAPASCTVAPPVLDVVVSTPVCNSVTNTYTATGTVSLTNAVAGTLTIADNGITTATISVTAGQTTASFSLTGVSDASSHTVIASEGNVTATTTYAAPASCTVCSLSLTTSALANGQVGSAYSQTLTTSGGVSPLSYSVSSGNLPTGLSLNATTGVISGTPTISGSFSAIIVISDVKGCATTASLPVIQIGLGPLCSMTLTATPTSCNTATNQYNVTGTLMTTNASTPQSVTITDGNVSTVLVLTNAGPLSYTLTGLTSTGDLHIVTVQSAACGSSNATYSAPESCTVAPPTAGLGDYVFLDANKDGIQNTGDTPIAGVVVTLYTNGVASATTVTDASGFYSFTGLTPGSSNSYVVGFTAPSGMTATLANAGSDDAKDSDADSITGKTQSVTLASGEFNPTLDAGFYAPAPTLSLDKFVDKSKAKIGDLLTYTLVLTNSGTGPATNVVVRDSSSTGLAYVANSATAPAGTTFAAGVPVSTWTITSISGGQSLSLTFQAKVDSSGILYNKAIIPGDTASVCTSIPVVMCAGDVYTFLLTAAPGRSSYKWYKDNVEIIGQTSNTLEVSAPGTYSLGVDNVTGKCPDFSCCPFIVEEDTLPTFRAVAVPVTCVGNVAQSNGKLVLSGFNAAYTYQYSLGASFNEAASLSGAKKVIPADGVIVNNLANPGAALFYTIRVYNASGCSADVTVQLLPTICGCPADVCVPLVIKQTKRATRIGDPR